MCYDEAAVHDNEPDESRLVEEQDEIRLTNPAHQLVETGPKGQQRLFRMGKFERCVCDFR